MLYSILSPSLLMHKEHLRLSHKLVFIAKVVWSSVLLIMGARMAIVLPFSPVPITWQPQALIIIAFSFGKRVGVCAVLAYFAQGLSGLPVFTYGGGMGAFFSPTGGYLLGFLPAVYIMGAFADRGFAKNPLLAGLGILAGDVMLYSCGLLYLAHIIPTTQLLKVGLLPFLGSGVLQILVAAVIIPLLSRIRKKSM